MPRNKGHYLGTEIEETWWRRYTRPPFFARGNGEYWFDDQAFYFRRYLTPNPLVIPFRRISQVRTGHWHCGRWAWGATIVKLIWMNDGLSVSSGFVLSRREAEALQIVEDLERRSSLSSADRHRQPRGDRATAGGRRTRGTARVGQL